MSNIERVGNTAAASIPLLLAQAAGAGELRPGHRVLIACFGGGLTWGATTLVWPDISRACRDQPDQLDSAAAATDSLTRHKESRCTSS